MTVLVAALGVLGLVTGCGGGSGGDGAAAPGPVPGAIALPETGQTTCSSEFGALIACAGTGQDGELQAGVAWPNPRFVAGSGPTVDCVTDNLTGLMWVRAPSASAVTWATALTNANNLTLCGFSDWRLPNRKELRSLVNYGVADNAASMNTQGFTGVQGGFYWTSSTFAVDTTFAVLVRFAVGEGGAQNKNLNFLVWPVRAGQ